MLNFIYNLPWQHKSFIVACGFVPFILLVPLLKKLGLETNLSVAAWGLGYVIFLTTTTSIGTYPTDKTVWLLFCIMIIAGFILGGPINAMIGQAMHEAHNPSIPFAITSLGPVLTSLTLTALAILIPKYFENSFSWINMLGMLLIIGGCMLALYKAPTA